MVMIPAGYFSRSHLRSLGWPDELLRKTPHEKIREDGTPCYLYREADVQAVEKQRVMQAAAKAAQAALDAELRDRCARLVPRLEPTVGLFKTKKAARAAGYLSDSDMGGKSLAPKRDAVPITVKGEIFYAGEQCEDLLSQTAAKRRHLFVAENAEPAKTLSFHPGKIVHYSAYRISDCFPAKAVKPVSAGRTILKLFSALPGEKVGVTSDGDTFTIRDDDVAWCRQWDGSCVAEILCSGPYEAFLSLFDTGRPAAVVVRRTLPDTYVRESDGVVLPYSVVYGFRVVGGKIETVPASELWPPDDGVVYEEIEATEARAAELAKKRREAR